MRSFRKKKAQSIIEYAVAFVVVAAGLVAIGFIANAKGVFQNYFDDTIQEMGVNK